MATRNQTRPNCVRVKVELDLLKGFSKRINIELRKNSGEICER